MGSDFRGNELVLCVMNCSLKDKIPLFEAWNEIYGISFNEDLRVGGHNEMRLESEDTISSSK